MIPCYWRRGVFIGIKSDQNHLRGAIPWVLLDFRHTEVRIAAFIAFFLIAGHQELLAQKVNNAYRIRINRAIDPIRIDGSLDEASWSVADSASNFWQVTPMDTSRSMARTVVRLTYDEHAIYISAVCYDSLPGGFVVQSLRRDFMFGRNDNFLVFIDTFEDQTNGFSFGVNAAGAQWDGFMFNGANMDLGWDNKWTSKVVNYDFGYIFEAAIPFKTIRYKKGSREWGINFSRLDLKLNEKSSWAPVPRQFPTASLAFTGVLEWDELPPEAGTNISLIPYLLGGLYRNGNGENLRNEKLQAGFDAKFGVTPSLNLDLTVNPDFSQVEVDRQVTNLSRFELFFPERRQFFIENSDLFANFGFRELRPFFSRRIGLNSPIYGGARLSGRIDEDWRIGLMNIQTGEQDLEGIPGQNYAVMALQRQVFARSNISGLFVNRQSMGFDRTETDSSYTRYNRVAGIDYNLASSDNIWKGKFLLHKSFSPNLKGDDFAHAVDLEFDRRKLNMQWHHEYVGANYNPEVGYVPRRDYWSISPFVRFRMFPNAPKLVSHGFRAGTTSFWDAAGKLSDSETFLSYYFQFLNLSELSFWGSNDYLRLLAPFDPTNSGGEELQEGSDFQWNAFGINYSSTPVKAYTFGFRTRYGGYFNGMRTNISGELEYRWQPFASLAIDFSYNNIALPEPYTSTSFWLLSPRLDLTFTNTVFLTTFVQYNEQADNINLNARFQWRFKPASDIFLVYTDNYLPESFEVKSRAVVLKFTYWYNI